MELKEYFRPESLVDVKQILKSYSNVKLLAGGTDLVLELERDKVQPDYLIDLGKIYELKGITEDDKYISLGSMTTFTELRENKLIMKNFNSLFECAKNMGSPQIRNIATIGGNIANGGSAADIVPCLISLSGTLIIEQADNIRQISCENYYENYAAEKIKENEILTRILIPKKNEKSGYYKLGKRNSLAIARLSAAISLSVENNVINSIILSLGAVGRHAIRVKELEDFAIGKEINYLYDEEALRIIEATVYNSIKGRKTMPFKKEAAKGVYKEALSIALGSKN
jgi:CO/xanthine dehydrogenase FAD-binding subunit